MSILLSLPMNKSDVITHGEIVESESVLHSAGKEQSSGEVARELPPSQNVLKPKTLYLDFSSQTHNIMSRNSGTNNHSRNSSIEREVNFYCLKPLIVR